MTEGNITIRPTDADCWLVFTGGDYHTICVRHGDRGGSDNPYGSWVELMSHGSYGTFAHYWGAIGKRPWQEFLIGLEFDYAMGKLMGTRLRRKIGGYAQYERLCEHLDEMHEQMNMSQETVEKVKREAKACIDEGDFLSLLNERCDGVVMSFELYDIDFTEIDPQANNFWEKVWVPWVRMLGEQKDES